MLVTQHFHLFLQCFQNDSSSGSLKQEIVSCRAKPHFVRAWPLIWSFIYKGRKGQPFPKRQVLDPSKLKEFADDNSKFDENGKKVIQTGRKHSVEKEKLLITSNFFFSHSVFNRLVLQTSKSQGLFGKGLTKVAERRYGE